MSSNEDMWQAIIGGRDAQGHISGANLHVERPQSAVLPPKCADPELEAILEIIAWRAMAKPKGPTLPPTHCKQGHEYAVVGVYQYVNIKTPACRECARIYRRQWREKRKAAKS